MGSYRPTESYRAGAVAVRLLRRVEPRLPGDLRLFQCVCAQLLSVNHAHTRICACNNNGYERQNDHSFKYDIPRFQASVLLSQCRNFRSPACNYVRKPRNPCRSNNCKDTGYALLLQFPAPSRSDNMQMRELPVNALAFDQYRIPKNPDYRTCLTVILDDIPGAEKPCLILRHSGIKSPFMEIFAPGYWLSRNLTRSSYTGFAPYQEITILSPSLKIHVIFNIEISSLYRSMKRRYSAGRTLNTIW